MTKKQPLITFVLSFKKYQWISVDGIARNGKSGIRLIEKERPDLLFLDVELPDMLGMDLAIKVHEFQNWDMHIIFLYCL